MQRGEWLARRAQWPTTLALAIVSVSACMRFGYDQLELSSESQDTASGTNGGSSGLSLTSTSASGAGGASAATAGGDDGGESNSNTGGSEGSGGSRANTNASASSGGSGGSMSQGGEGGAGETPFELLSPATAVSVGHRHACALKSGALCCWGDNASGQLGLGSIGDPVLSPTAVGSDEWAAIEVGYVSSCGLNTQGEVYCWGDNTEGQLGQGDLEPRLVPTRVPLPDTALQVSMTVAHACAILADRSLYCWGRNWEGELGQDDAVNAPPEPTPLRLGQASDWLDIAAGEGHTCGLRRPGTLWCWGRNTNGQLGVGSTSPNQYRSAQRVLPNDDWQDVNTGSFLSCATRASGEASCWGVNDVGQAIPGAPDPQLSPDRTLSTSTGFNVVEGHLFHSCALNAEGHALCWGRNQEGQLGLGTSSTSEAQSPVLDPSDSTSPMLWTSLSAGRFVTCLVSRAGDIYCTGANELGQLGLGDTERRSRVERLAFP